ncbi:hypothetical protein BVX97_01110 [bacterium E08(2017)]|nr:hypothetical protein BVX97_01110 [bacterium E08(2017)]
MLAACTSQADVNSDLYFAVKEGHLDRVSNLLDQGANPNYIHVKTRTRRGKTIQESESILTRASRAYFKDDSRQKNLQILATLVDAGAVAGQSDSNVLFEPVWQNQPEVCSLLLKAKASPFTFSEKQPAGLTPMVLATMHGHKAVQKVLNAAGAPTIKPKEAVQLQFIFYLTKGSDEEVLEQFLKNGADVNQKDIIGRTPLVSCFSGRNDLDEAAKNYRWLMNHGSEINLCGGNLRRMGMYPLHAAIDFTSPYSYGGKTREACLTLYKEMLDAGADPSTQSSDGSTPLHWASKCGNIPAAETLLSAKVNPSAKDKTGKTPLDYAKQWPEMSTLLQKHGGKKSDDLHNN